MKKEEGQSEHATKIMKPIVIAAKKVDADISV